MCIPRLIEQRKDEKQKQEGHSLRILLHFKKNIANNDKKRNNDCLKKIHGSSNRGIKYSDINGRINPSACFIRVESNNTY